MLNDSQDNRARLYGEVTKLVKIRIEGEEFEVPDQLELLRCFQYLDFEIAFENFCWNASCENCTVDVACGTKKAERSLLCQLPAEEGMVIDRLPEGVRKRTR